MSIFEENCLAGARGAMSDECEAVLAILGQGDAILSLRSLWRSQPAEVGKSAREELILQAVHLLNLVLPTLRSAGDAYTKQGVVAVKEDWVIDLCAFFLDRLKFMPRGA